MKNLANTVFPLFVLMIFAGCNSSDSSNTPPVSNPGTGSQSAPSLTGLSTEDTIKTKYDSAILHCELKFPFQVRVNGQEQSDEGAAAADWDLLKDYSEQKTLKMDAKSFNTHILVDLEIEKVEISGMQVNEDEATGAIYKTENSPVITGSYSYQSSNSVNVEGMVSKPSGEGKFTFNEGITNTFVNVDTTGQLGDGSSSAYGYTVQLGCELNTKLKPAYADQFSKT
jgi:hypothetical protein